jgi:hypothetical protein
VIKLVRVEDTVRFEVDVAHAREAGLKMSSRLLGLAHRVFGRPREAR